MIPLGVMGENPLLMTARFHPKTSVICVHGCGGNPKLKMLIFELVIPIVLVPRKITGSGHFIDGLIPAHEYIWTDNWGQALDNFRLADKGLESGTVVK